MRVSKLQRRRVAGALLLSASVFLAGVLSPAAARAEGPRWVTGPPYFNNAFQSVVWYTNSPLYFTDPGDLSAYVDHAAADALVAAAANVWNIPTASLGLAQGGELAEHISSLNVYLGPNGPVFPADAAASNYAGIQIAIVYDSDGSITDLLLGQGASDPAECAQSGVTESVDSILFTGAIQHALIFINGRCTGADPNQQLQLQYQLVRTFGRVLGLGWSQTNDNVFTGDPAPNTFQAQNWPIMHPIDIICGSFTFQCMPLPFTLRPDDIGSLSGLYPIAQGAAPPGKIASKTQADEIAGRLFFPDGQGIQGMNLTVRRHRFATPDVDPGDIVSAVTGSIYRQNNGNVVTGPASTSTSALALSASMGGVNPPLEGAFDLYWIPVLAGQVIDDALVTGEPINPLYSGPYAVGPYQDGPVAPSGPTFGFRDNEVMAFERNFYVLTVDGAAGPCVTTGQGTATAPAAVPATGWWSGTLCGYGDVAWPMLPIAANRSFMVEIMALDQQANATTAKLRPLVGVWNVSDPTNTLPTVAATPSPFNSLVLGSTSLNASVTSASSLRLAIADERGDGRPDYAYSARVLYAATVSPETLPAGGGAVTIAGMGFRPGCQVTINGVAAVVVGSTANAIVAIAPPFAVLGAATTAVDVVVTDPTTGGSSTMSAALGYPSSGLPGIPESVSALTPLLYVAAGLPVPLMEQAVVTDGGAPLAGLALNFSSTAGALSFSPATENLPGTASLLTQSSAQGIASVTATVGPLTSAAESVGLACAPGNICASFSAIAVDPSQWLPTALLNAAQSVPSNGVLLPVIVQIVDTGGHPVIGAPVSIDQTVTAYEACPATGSCPVAATLGSARSALVSDSNGLIVVNPLQVGASPQTVHIAIATGTQGFLPLTLEKSP